MRRVRFILILTVLACLAVLPASGALLSKSYAYKPGVMLELDARGQGGLRLDHVQFFPPRAGKGKLFGGNAMQVDVAVSNLGDVSQKIAIAIALFDGDGRLLGVASGGSKMMSIRPSRQSTYTLSFSGVNASTHRAQTFQISVEAK